MIISLPQEELLTLIVFSSREALITSFHLLDENYDWAELVVVQWWMLLVAPNEMCCRKEKSIKQRNKTMRRSMKDRNSGLDDAREEEEKI